jgi:hypothetical protein
MVKLLIIYKQKMLDALNTFIKEKIFCGKKRNKRDDDLNDFIVNKKRKIEIIDDLKIYKILISNTGFIESGPMIINLIDNDDMILTENTDIINYIDLNSIFENDLSLSDMEIFENLFVFTKKKQDFNNYPIINMPKFKKYCA